ncbi:hypothetical protein Clacol_004993 [Clathrus columnatus]|uniref:3-isopropylmalate dehydratase n=1 Tax=Clathrus columnatus TaxID=1419009 RepID=A0AAV5AFP6_9AGAM|nr:hypothetical protein Clacol_004993 [Clathrus columnatus]
MPAPVVKPRTLYDKIWDDHVVYQQEDGSALLYIDSRNAGRQVRRTDCTLSTVDHNIPTLSRKNYTSIKTFVEEPESRIQCMTLEDNVKEFGVTYFGMGDRRQGIVHIIGPEQGFTLPGITCVCGDSHTSTHGAFGALAFGIGTSEVEHVLATQTLLQRKSKNMRITVDGNLSEGVSSKDVILHIIGVIGTAGGTGSVIEYAGSVFRNFSMEARMSVCNMSIEAGARAGMIAPDETTFAYLKGRPLAPAEGESWDRAIEFWRTLKSDEGAKFDVEVNIKAEDIAPTVSWGTSPQDVVPITGIVPDPTKITDPTKRASMERSLNYMGLTPGTRMEDIKVDKVFLGSCTNGRIEDLRSAAKVILAAGPNAKVPESVVAMVVPGSTLVRQQAEAEGLSAIFIRAGWDWREAGCSMCLGMNPDQLSPKERCASTSNRNFEGRQGAGGRTHLLSPAMAAATAMSGKLTDVRKFVGGKDTTYTTDTILTKQLNPLEFLTDKVLPPPIPEGWKGGSSSVPSGAGGSQAGSRTFTVLKGIAAPLDMENIDTDMIVPKQFLKTIKRTGLKDALFYAFRWDPATGAETDFILNRAPYNKACILVCTGANFGCGSSREHAPWSLKDFGIQCIIAPSFAEIFMTNTMQNGMLPCVLSREECKVLYEDALSHKDIEVDLEKQEVRRENGQIMKFTLDPFRRHCLLNGLDDIALTLQKSDAISAFEKRRTEEWPWLDGFANVKEGKVGVADTSGKKTKFDW